MNFRKLTNFWRKGGTKGAENRDHGNSTSLQGAPLHQQQQRAQGQGAMGPFENKQAALQYIVGLLESAERNVLPMSCTHSKKDCTGSGMITCAATAESSASVVPTCCGNSTKEYMHALRREREEMLAALELCLLAVPEEVTGKTGVCETRGAADAQATAVDCSEDQAAVSEEPALMPEVPNNDLQDNNDARIITQEAWRWLLHRIVKLLFEMDCYIYADAMMQSRQSCLITTPLGLSPPTPSKVPSDRPKASLTALVIDDGEIPAFEAVQRATPSKKGASLTSSKMIGEANNEAKLNKFRNNEEKLALVNSLTTWIIMQDILQHQLRQQDSFVSLSVELLSPATEKKTASAISVHWENVVEDLMRALGTSQRKTAEVVISLWMLHDASGNELVQCILQYPQCHVSTLPEGKPQVPSDTALVNKTSEGQTVHQHTTSLMERVVDAIALDDLLEEVENVYEQSVVLTWVAYIEEQSSVSMIPKTKNQDVILPLFDLCHCHNMAAYAICSPYWNEEKRQETLQLLRKAWDEMHEPAVVTETNNERHSAPVELLEFRSICVDVYGGVNTALSVVGGGVNGSDVLPEDQHKTSCVSQLSPERVTTVSDVDIQSSRTLSMHCMHANCTRTAMSMAGSRHSAFEEDLLPFVTQQLWVVVLHLRVEQCLNISTPRLQEAELCAHEEGEFSLAGCSFSCRQSARESLVKLRIATGIYPDALKAAHAHFAHAKKEWLYGKKGCGCGLKYLNSMVLLAQVQEVSRMDTSILETVQLALPQAELCEQAFHEFTSASGASVVRHAALQHGVRCAKLFLLRTIWRAYHRMDDTTNTAKYFEQYLECVKCVRRSRRNEDMYAALKERGEQLKVEKQYGSVVLAFQQAVECAKSMSQVLSTALPATAAATTTVAKVTGTGPDATVPDGTDSGCLNAKEREVDALRREAESERNLALAYVLQAEHEVNVRCRRQQLSNAVNSAYAAQNALQRCISKVKPPSSRTLVDVTASLVVAARALLRLGQPKKAALLLEPLIEDKLNSASVRPPLWSDALPDPTQLISARDLEERIETLQLKFKAYDVHTQCLSKFDGERACREITRVRIFLKEVKLWASTQLSIFQLKATVLKEEFQTMLFVNKRLLTETLLTVNALQPTITITCGDAWAMLGEWEKALQEYSNALAMYADRHGENMHGYTNSSKSYLIDTEKERERVWNNYFVGESLVFAKLAEVYSALKKPKTAIHYYRQVLDYASEAGDALLLYNAHIRLARLYTATDETGEAEAHWAKVSALAKGYEDQEISRETMRNIIAAQRAKCKYADVIITAKELDTLASGAEGVDAAADKRFALEALAGAYLHLGQYKECIEALDEREKVQCNCRQWKGILFNTRARALLGDGEVQKAINVLMIWDSEARQARNLVEVGHANAVLALAYATCQRIFEAKRHHEIALSAFSKVSKINSEDRNAVADSARWLVHHFYLNDEEVLLVEKTSRLSSSKANPGTSSAVSNSATGGDEFQVKAVSGDLNVLMREEEKRLRKVQEFAGVSGNSTGTYALREEGDTEGFCFNGDNDDDDDEEVVSNNSFDSDLIAILDGGTPATTSNSKKVTLTRTGRIDDISAPVEKSTARSVASTASTTTPHLRSLTTSIAKVSLCKRPAFVEGEIVASPERAQVDIAETVLEPPSSADTRVQTLCFSRALEIIETVTQLSLMPLQMRQRLIPRNPADAVDLALLAFPRCTFVFYFLEFATQYVAIVRPARRSFFLRRSVQAYALKDFHKKQLAPSSTREAASLACADSLLYSSGERKENRLSAIASSLGSFTRRSRAGSVDVSLGIPDLAAESAVANEEFQQCLHDLHEDLWSPIRGTLRMAHCFNNEAECFVFILDPTLLHVPFPALHGSGVTAEPLGQQFTMVVAPCVAQFLSSMQHEEDPCFLNAPQEDICVFLPEKTVRCISLVDSVSSGNLRADVVASRKSSVATTRSSVTASLDGPHLGSAAAHQSPEKCRHCTFYHWTSFTGCTRKEIISAFSSPSARALMVLCDPVKHMFKVADGMVRLEDLTRGRPYLSESLNLVVVTNDASIATSIEEPGVAARLCLDHGCRRVLRIDLLSGASITEDHQRLVLMYLEKLRLALEWRMRYPYALALRMTQEAARRLQFPPLIWASLTLVGAS
ncbi:hypothetical protein TraAM80_05166 [Trypanosoma rangeli]|uniref:Uncharacterized protein n=1 Tax=Trypanosoma rangeli TaxID=5698 RepID=A0A422NG60_TRYRA|nr:uncharacterized protein TraAM80_05166 [Trypanosoma rangeli]RNF04451.1 hypothetical protein TraAM80_05166 [Trypanosoma rangeli]|eukprot:RNF04451.1 hypothetical protein TraAM80_05166 [Trypanosoma rangeli]